MRIIACVIALLFLITCTYAGDFVLKSKGFADHKRLPVVYSCDGGNKAPELSWTNPPDTTQSYALILSVPDAPIGRVFYSWVVFNIPADITELPGDDKVLPEGAVLANNSYGDPIYNGPCPVDEGVYHYVFTLYALDSTLELSADADLEDILEEVQRHTIKQTSLTSFYSH